VVFGNTFATCLICPVNDFTNQSSWVLYKKGDFEFSAAESQDSYIGYGFAKINDKKVFAVSPYGDWGWFESIETAGEPSQAHVVGSPLVGSNVEVAFDDAIPQTYPIREYLLERRINNAIDSITAGLEDWRKVDSALADENGDAVNVIATKIPEATTLQYRMACIDKRGYRGEEITINPENAIEDTLPLISGSNGNLGEKTETTYSSITFDYDVQDPIELGEEASQEQLNGWGIAEIREAIDGKTVKVREGPITSNNAVTSLYTFYMDHAEWQKLSNGIHTVQIIAKNNRNRMAVRSKTFTKKVDEIVMYLSNPIQAATMPTTLHPTIMTQYPSGAILKVEATNNAFDSEPVWQDITVEIISNQAVNFTNTEVPTSGQYGINIRASLKRNNKAGPCWISYLGGYFA
jgi:hypothetical protein